MPTYVYACKNCGYGFEQHQSFSDDALVTCPECGQDSLRKVFNSVGIVFKGSGFYKTDSRSSTPTASSGTGTSSGTSDTGSADGGSSNGSSSSSTTSDTSSSAPAPSTSTGSGGAAATS